VRPTAAAAAVAKAWGEAAGEGAATMPACAKASALRCGAGAVIGPGAAEDKKANDCDMTSAVLQRKRG